MDPQYCMNLLPVGNRMASGESDLAGYEDRLVYPNGCTVMLCTSGYACVCVNLRKQVLRKGDFIFLFGGSSFSLLRKSAEFQVSFVTCLENVIEDTFCKISSSAFWDFICVEPIVNTNEAQYSDMLAWFRISDWIVKSCISEFQPTLLNGHIYTLCMAVDSEVRRNPEAIINQYKDRAWVLLRKFSHLLAVHCHHTREVSFYADKLNISRDYLYKLTERGLGKKPKEIIDRQTEVEIKIYLSHTDMSIKDIADAMNFNDTAYMCRFFKRMTGMTPSEYRLK